MIKFANGPHDCFDENDLLCEDMGNKLNKSLVVVKCSSAGFLAGDYAEISINGVGIDVDRNEHGHYRGFHIVIINPSNGKGWYKVFDTHTNGDRFDAFIEKDLG